jgi:hypothetical protein
MYLENNEKCFAIFILKNNNAIDLLVKNNHSILLSFLIYTMWTSLFKELTFVTTSTLLEEIQW